eukprot:scaffold31712_cov37-Prasinocladus_malaysianus.AAC.1
MEAKKENEARVSEARKRYDVICGAERAEHEERLAAARGEFRAECERMTREYEGSTVRALEEWESLSKMLEAKNNELMEVRSQ